MLTVSVNPKAGVRCGCSSEAKPMSEFENDPDLLRGTPRSQVLVPLCWPRYSSQERAIQALQAHHRVSLPLVRSIKEGKAISFNVAGGKPVIATLGQHPDGWGWESKNSADRRMLYVSRAFFFVEVAAYCSMHNEDVGNHFADGKWRKIPMDVAECPPPGFCDSCQDARMHDQEIGLFASFFEACFALDADPKDIQAGRPSS